jgi:peptidoglycan hydrolase-like protein with peptidoglycan-binding domain
MAFDYGSINSGGATFQGLNSLFAARMAAALQAAYNATGEWAQATSGVRTYTQQADLYNRYMAGTGGIAAKPGLSLHEQGMAMDLKAGKARDWIQAHAQEYGLEPAIPKRGWKADPPHIQLARGIPATKYDTTPYTGLGAPLARAGMPVPPRNIPNPVAPTAPILQRGMTDRSTGGAVSALQRQLQQAGYNLGRFGPLRNGVDGNFGPVTRDALKKFQADQGLTRDAVAGPQTQAALARVATPPWAQSVTPPAVSPMDYGFGNLPAPVTAAGAQPTAPGGPPAPTGPSTASLADPSGAYGYGLNRPVVPLSPQAQQAGVYGPYAPMFTAPGGAPTAAPPTGTDATKIPGMPTTIVTDPSQALPGGAPLPSPAAGVRVSAYGRPIGGLPTSAALAVMPLPRPRPTAQPDFAGAFAPGPSLSIERPTIATGAPTPPPAQGSGDSYPPNPTAGMNSGYGAGLNLAGQPPPGGPPSPGGPASLISSGAQMAAGASPPPDFSWSYAGPHLRQLGQAVSDEVSPFGQAIGGALGPGGPVFGASDWANQQLGNAGQWALRQLGMGPTSAATSDNITNNLVQSIYGGGGGMTAPGGPGYSVMSQAPPSQPSVTPSWGMGGGGSDGGGWGSLGSAPGGPGGFGNGGGFDPSAMAAAYGVFSQQDPRQQQQQGYGYGGGYY